MIITADKEANLEHAAAMIKKATDNGAKIVALPETFNCPYEHEYFRKFAEEVPGGKSSNFLSDMAKKYKIYIIGGSVPEVENGKYYNTLTVFGPTGNLFAKHRKMHLFNMDIPGKCTFYENETFTPGNALTMFDTEYCKVGVGVCYDIRFPELAQLYAKRGCKLLFYPGAFDLFCGDLQWEMLLRARALDNEVFAAAIGPARDPKASYVAWGHSTFAGPWGNVLGSLDEKEGILYQDIDLKELDDVRKMIPIHDQNRKDLYNLEFLK